jgi:hypothetical protein
MKCNAAGILQLFDERLLMNTIVPSRIIKILRREAASSDSPDFLEVLFAESVARRWFLENGIPCWRTSQHSKEKDRYSLLFSNGRRAIVAPEGRNRVSFDTMAGAKCDYLLSVVMTGGTSGHVKGYFYLFDIRKPDNIEWRPDIENLELRKMDTFPELACKPRHLRLSYFLKSLRLLLAGEVAAPHPMEPDEISTEVSSLGDRFY